VVFSSPAEEPNLFWAKAHAASLACAGHTTQPLRASINSPYGKAPTARVLRLTSRNIRSSGFYPSQQCSSSAALPLTVVEAV
jgi:hypothetical protein